jgi:hypothetical protein
MLYIAKMRSTVTRVGYLAAGLAGVAGVLWIFAYARQDDGYYAQPGFTHWDHASKGGGATLAVICLSFATAIALAFIAQAVFVKRSVIRGFALPLAIAYGVMLYGAFFWLTVGH